MSPEYPILAIYEYLIYMPNNAQKNNIINIYYKWSNFCHDASKILGSGEYSEVRIKLTYLPDALIVGILLDHRHRY